MSDQDIQLDHMYRLAQQICAGLAGGDYVYCLEEDKFYHYKQGYWQHIYDTELIKNVSQYPLKYGDKLVPISKFSLNGRRTIVDNIKVINDLRLSCFNQAPLINLNNYMFDPVGINIVNHNKNFYSNVRIPYSYDKALDCKLWMKTLNEIMEGDINKISLLQEFFGYCLTRDTKQEKALLLLGESRSGKSTILEILHHLVGDANCASVPLKYLSNPQYTPMLINKLVNIDTDVSAKAQEFEAEFRVITSGEKIHCNQKFIPAFDFIPFCKLVMAANIFPRITDHSSAFYKRLLLIPCDRIFSEEEQNKNLKSELKNELPGILNWAIDGLTRLNKRGMFKQYDFMKDAVEDLENDNNPINLFFNEHIEIAMGSETEKGDLYKKYKEWSDINKNYPLPHNKFSSCIFKRFHKQTPKDVQNKETGKRIWRNIKYVHFKDYDKQEVSWEPATDIIPQIDKVVNAVEISTGTQIKSEEINWEN